MKWEDIDYQSKQINLRRVWVAKTIVERLKTDDSEAPVPLTDLLSHDFAGLAKRDGVRKTKRLGFRQHEMQRKETEVEQVFLRLIISVRLRSPPG